MKSRSDIASEEATRDPVFVFQRARLVITDASRADYCSDCDRLVDPGISHDCGNDASTLTNAAIVEAGTGQIEWDVVGVYATREEAEAHGRSRAYRYKGGWRVYCVPAEGALVDVLPLLNPFSPPYETLTEDNCRLTEELDAVVEQRDALGAELDIMREKLHRIQDWCNAYPLDVFPEPDMAQARALLQAGGVDLGAVAASNMRHVLSGIMRIIGATSDATQYIEMESDLLEADLHPMQATGQPLEDA